MKKALAILLALSMVFAAFADEPVTNYSVAEFSGSAELGWKSDLDKETNGLFNKTEANLKINLLTGGSKATTGDGVWGELAINIDTPDALTNPGALAIGKTASVSTAKIHFVDGDVGIALNMLAPNLKLADDYNVTGALTNGFGIAITSAPIEVAFTVMDNGVAKDKAWGFGANASIKAIDALTLKGAFAYNDKDANKLAATADASYKIAINDTMSVTPAVAFKMLGDNKKALDASVNYLWGGVETEVDFAGKGTGFTVAYGTGFKNKDGSLTFSAYDTVLDTLKLGVKYGTTVADFAKGTLYFGAAYSVAIDIIDFSVHGGAKLAIGADDVLAEYKYGATISTDDVIDNTVLSLNYEAGEYAEVKDDKGTITDDGKHKLGTITVSAKISL